MLLLVPGALANTVYTVYIFQPRILPPPRWPATPLPATGSRSVTGSADGRAAPEMPLGHCVPPNSPLATALLSTTCLPKMAGSEAGSVAKPGSGSGAAVSALLGSPRDSLTGTDVAHTLPAEHPPHRDTNAVAGAVPGSGSVAAPHHAPPPTHAPRAPLCAHGSFSASCSTAPSAAGCWPPPATGNYLLVGKTINTSIL